MSANFYMLSISAYFNSSRNSLLEILNVDPGLINILH